MKITLEPTDQIVSIQLGSADLLARVWRGTTEKGIAVECLIPRIAARADQDLSQFEAELRETAAPTILSEVFPLRMVL